ncbi:hypothetical protein FRC15_004550 [Serendipita sp. 397]|nr:hypothetical protein FRC15_004550 [Serendipita sp. 397]
MCVCAYASAKASGSRPVTVCQEIRQDSRFPLVNEMERRGFFENPQYAQSLQGTVFRPPDQANIIQTLDPGTDPFGEDPELPFMTEALEPLNFNLFPDFFPPNSSIPTIHDAYNAAHVIDRGLVGIPPPSAIPYLPPPQGPTMASYGSPSTQSDVSVGQHLILIDPGPSYSLSVNLVPDNARSRCKPPLSTFDEVVSHAPQLQKYYLKTGKALDKQLCDSVLETSEQPDGTKRIKCTFPNCETSYPSRSSSAKCHVYSHIGYRRHKCPFGGCTYASYQRSDLRVHFEKRHQRLRRPQYNNDNTQNTTNLKT